MRRLKSSEKRFPQPSNVHYTWKESLVTAWFPTNQPIACAHLERLLSSVDKLMSLQLRALHKSLPTLGTHMDTGTVDVEVLSQSSTVSEHFVTTLNQQ